MNRLLRHIVLTLSFLVLLPATALGWERGDVKSFATLPAGFGNPEGITADARGNLYVTTFAVTGSAPGQMFVFDGRNGKLIRQVSIAGSSNLLLGLAFHPQTGDLLVIDFGNGNLLKVDPQTGASSEFAAVGGSSGLNALTFDTNGNVYFSDSFQGIVWKTGPNGGAASVWASDPLLATAGVPPFGANGLAFNNAGDSLLVANTGDDRVIRIPVLADGGAGSPEVFVNSVNGADGLFIDEDDNVWLAANQADEIVVTDKTGKVIAKLGDFDGIDRRGAPKGLLFPASMVRVGEWVYVTNLSLDLRLFDDSLKTVDSQWAARVRTHTVSRIRAAIGHSRDSDD